MAVLIETSINLSINILWTDLSYYSVRMYFDLPSAHQKYQFTSAFPLHSFYLYLKQTVPTWVTSNKILGAEGLSCSFLHPKGARHVWGTAESLTCHPSPWLKEYAFCLQKNVAPRWTLKLFSQNMALKSMA